RRDDTRAADKNRRGRTQTERGTDQLSDAFRMLRRLADDVRSVAPVDKDVCEGGEGCQEVPQPEVDRSERSADRTSQHDCQHCRRDPTRAEMEDVPGQTHVWAASRERDRSPAPSLAVRGDGE